MDMNTSHPAMTPMSMSSTFSTSTKVTLFFKEWTTTSPASYVAAILFLLLLAILNRYLAALKSQLERSWNHQHDLNTRSRSPSDISARHQRYGPPSRRLSKYPTDARTADDPEAEPLSPPPYAHADAGLEHKTGSVRSRSLRSKVGGFLPWRWVANGPWQISNDGSRAVLEFCRAFIGYILMLAVMTFNIGILFAVLGGVLLGELILGRYTSGGNEGWQEGGCHDG